MTGFDDAEPVSRIERVLADRYGLRAAEMTRLPIGQGAINYRADGADFTVFVKRYVPGTDIGKERAGIRLSEIAASAGIPAASVIRNPDGDAIDCSTGIPVSVWAWVEGSVRKSDLGERAFAEIGRMLGIAHRTFAAFPESDAPAEKTRAWFRLSLPTLVDAVNSLRARIAQRLDAGTSDAFDRTAIVDLAERRAQLAALPCLIESLPRLTSQVLHGDYALVNILFDRSGISAVLDFRAPEPFLIAYELGRVAFSPEMVAGRYDWIQAARRLIGAYIAENPGVARNDIVHCGRVALLQLLRSLYGVKEHYLRPGLIQADLDVFWRLRHRAASLLLNRIREVDAMLRSAAAS